MENVLLTRSRPVIDHLNKPIRDRDQTKHMKAFMLRDDLRLNYSFAIPSQEAIEALVGVAPIVEIGAGTGYWAALVEDRGGDVICYDRFPNCEENFYTERNFHNINHGDERVAADHPDRTLFISWPDDFNQDRGWSDRALEMYLETGGTTFALISEGRGGAAGSARLFDIIESEMKLVETVGIPTFPGLHDVLQIYTV